MSATPLLISPNSVLANALLRSIDMLRPRVRAMRPRRIEFVVGTQINGAPHLGTNLVQTTAFLLAKIARREFPVETSVRFGALDNAPYDVILDPETHHAYQATYFHALGKTGVDELISRYYRAFFDSLSEATATDYTLETYTDQQTSPAFRAEFLRSLERLDEIRWWMAPSHGVVHTRLPCPGCGWAEKRADRTGLVDGALGVLDTPGARMPLRIFTPQVLAPTGAKLSKSLLRDRSADALPADVEPWMLDTTRWEGGTDHYVDALLWLVGELLTDPKHFFRSFTVKEPGRLMNDRPADLDQRPRAHEMGIYKRYFDLIASGEKTTEIRVNDSSRQRLKEGDLLRFKCRDEEVLTRITRIARYRDFDEMFDHEPVSSVNPTASREDQLRNVREIYPPEREALGVMAIGIELVET
ncbi:ASCH domain-containing protein [Nocardiopsis alba]|uniref:ASCH domain-containing protein n=1 Tax=Nocardiopsis alba TaxID=53437 RepID=UPI003818A48F